MEFELKDYQSKLTEIMRTFDVFCTEHHLRYSMAAGSMIGVIRHKGFIPWDDDVDVCMPRSDYNRFLELTTSGMKGYKVLSVYNTPEFYNSFAKIIDPNTSLIETSFYKKCMIGVFLDIFPLDGIEADQKAFRKRLKWVQHYINWANTILSGKHFGFAVKSFILRCMTTHDRLLRKADQLAQVVPFETADQVCCFCGAYGERGVMPREWFESYEERPFEGIPVKVITHWHEYLTLFFNEYMIPPSPEKQISHHYHYFIDLSKKWELEDVLKLDLPETLPIDYTYE